MIFLIQLMPSSTSVSAGSSAAWYADIADSTGYIACGAPPL